MRYTLISASIAFLVSLSLAASIPGLPSCAGGCVPADLGGCNTIDVKCICSNSELLSNLACCVSTACSKADQDSTIQFADSICAGQGVSNLPSAATCASTASATTSSSALPSSASVISSSGSAVANITAITTGSAASSLSSLISSASSAAASVTGSSSGGSTGTTTGSSGTASSAASSSGTAAAAASSGAAGKAEFAGLGAILAGALAVL